MERRHFLKLAFGFAAGAAALAASAQAAPLMPQPLAGNGQLPADQNAHPAVTSGEEVDRLQPEEVRWGRHRRLGSSSRLGSSALGLAPPTSLGLAPPPLGLASPSLAPPLASSVLVAQRRLKRIRFPGSATIAQAIKKPRASGAFSHEKISCSDRTAASITPGEAVGADAADRPHHDDRRGNDDRSGVDHDNAAAIGLAAAIGSAMPAGAASASGIRGAEACERTGDQNCCEKVLHVFSRF